MGRRSRTLLSIYIRSLSRLILLSATFDFLSSVHQLSTHTSSLRPHTRVLADMSQLKIAHRGDRAPSRWRHALSRSGVSYTLHLFPHTHTHTHTHTRTHTRTHSQADKDMCFLRHEHHIHCIFVTLDVSKNNFD
jgi:hypothetical protein